MITPQQYTLNVWTATDVENSNDIPPELKSVMAWVRSYIIRPHHELGRPGVVCPFVPDALNVRKLWLATSSNEELTEDRLEFLVRDYVQYYRYVLNPNANELASLIIALPGIDREKEATVISNAHRKLKPEIVCVGLMLGEFYSNSDSPGLHNPLFRPLQSPLPLMVVRQMVAKDFVFLSKTSDPPDARLAFISSYIRFFKTKLSRDRLAAALTALNAATSELEDGMIKRV